MMMSQTANPARGNSAIADLVFDRHGPIPPWPSRMLCPAPSPLCLKVARIRAKIFVLTAAFRGWRGD